MTIVIDIRALMRSKISGVTVYIQNLIEQILKLDMANQYILYYNGAKNVPVPEFTGNNVLIVKTKIPNKLLNLCLWLFNSPRLDRLITKKTGKKVDLFFTPDLRPTALSKGIKKIVTVHDLSFVKYPKTFSFKARLWHKILQPKREIKTADKIIAVSQFTKKEVMDFYKIPAEKISVIYHGAQLKSVTPPAIEKVRQQFSLPAKFIFTLSAIEPRKNLHNVVKAVELLRKKEGFDYNLVIAGQRDDDIFHMPYIEQKDFIRFLGKISDAEKTALYKLCSCFVFASFYEGFGLPVLEAMKAGCPLVVAKGSALEEIVADTAIVVDPYDLVTLANGLESALIKGRESELVEKAAERAKEFSWKKCAGETLEIFTEQLSN